MSNLFLSGIRSVIIVRCLLLALPAFAVETVEWNVDQNGSWHDGANWTPHPPTSGDDVVIDRLNKQVTVQHTTGTTTINSLTLNEYLEITNSSIAVGDGLEIGSGYRLRLTGSGATFSAAGAVDFDGAAIYAGPGSSISLPTATSFLSDGTPPFLSDCFVHADGGSIDLSGLTSFQSTERGFARADAKASNGGTIDMSNVGDVHGGVIQLIADGASSQLDASSIATISGGYVFGSRSKLQATNGGTLLVGAVTYLDRVDLVSDGTGTMATAQIVNFTRGTATISGGTPDFSGMTNIDGASFVVSGGATVSVPHAVGWSDPSPDSLAKRYFTTGGIGSYLDLSTLLSLAPTTGSFTPLSIGATGGGTTDLGTLPQITSGVVRVDANGASSVVDLDNLVQFSATYLFVGDRSYLKATGGGTIRMSKLKTLDQVDLYIDGTGTMATSQIEDFNNGTAFVSGTSTQPDFSGMTQIDGASFDVRGGAQVSLSATSYFDLADETFPKRRFKVTGTNSQLDVSAITTFRTSDVAFAEMYIEAYEGGRVNLSGLTEPHSDTGTVKIIADGTSSLDGTPSQVDLSGLTQFKVNPQFAVHSSITAVHGGQVNMPNLTALEYVHLENDGTGSMQIAQIEEYARGTCTMTGGNYEFTNLTSIHGASFVALGGAVISAPSASYYDDTASGAFSDRLLRAEGDGSRIDLSNLPDLDTTPAAFTLLSIEARAGGFVDLGGLTTFDTGAVQILSDGTSSTGTPSVVDLSSLTTFTPLEVFGEESKIAATNGGEIRLGFVPMPGLNLNVSSGGRIVVGDYELCDGAVLSGNGTFDGNLGNHSTVSPGNSPDTLVIGGDYDQGADGTLLIELLGTDEHQWDVLQIAGAATLGGTLDVDLLEGFTPELGQSFEFLTAADGVTGRFTNVLLPTLDDGLVWTLDYGTNSVILATVPEPSTVLLLAAAGLCGLSYWRRLHRGMPSPEVGSRLLP